MSLCCSLERSLVGFEENSYLNNRSDVNSPCCRHRSSSLGGFEPSCRKRKGRKSSLSNYTGSRQSASQPYSDDFYLTPIDHSLIATQGTRKNPREERSFGELQRAQGQLLQVTGSAYACPAWELPSQGLAESWERSEGSRSVPDLSLALCHSACRQQLQATTRWEWSFQGGEEQPNTPLKMFQYLLLHCSTPPADSRAALTQRSAMPLIKTD